MHRTTGAALVAALALGLASCGGSSPLSKAELGKRGSAICATRNAQIAKLQRSLERQGKMDQRVALERSIPIVGKSLDDLAALKPADGLRARYATFLAWERRNLVRSRRVLTELKLHGAAKPNPESEAQIHGEGVQHIQLGADLGLRACLR